MKTYFFAAFFIIIFSAGCQKDKTGLTETLHRKWQVYSTKIIKLDDSFSGGACSYKTVVSDLYGQPTIPACQDDDIYDFTDKQNLVVYSGSKKCLSTEPASRVRPYRQNGDSLHLDGTSFYIVHLSKDTLILDYCKDMNLYPPGTVINRAKIGMKFIAVK